MSEGGQYGNSLPFTFSRWLCLQVAFFVLLGSKRSCVIGQKNNEIRGEIQNSAERDYQAIAAQCFMGLGLASCRFEGVYEKSTGYSLNPSFYAEQVIKNWGTAQYCLGCCSSGGYFKPDEVWPLYCPVTLTEAASKNYFGYEVRVVRNRFVGDTGVTWCPFYRSSCDYDADRNQIGICYQDNSYLHAYSLVMDVYEKTNGLSYWKNVESCNVTTLEIPNVRPKFINETIHMHSFDQNWQGFTLAYIFITLLILFIISCSLRFFRNKRCLVCNKPLIYFIDVCLVCRMLGAEAPDPLLIERLKERGRKIQGAEAPMIVESEDVEYLKEKAVYGGYFFLHVLKTGFLIAKKYYRTKIQVRPFLTVPRCRNAVPDTQKIDWEAINNTRIKIKNEERQKALALKRKELENRDLQQTKETEISNKQQSEDGDSSKDVNNLVPLDKLEEGKGEMYIDSNKSEKIPPINTKQTNENNAQDNVNIDNTSIEVSVDSSNPKETNVQLTEEEEEALNLLVEQLVDETYLKNKQKYIIPSDVIYCLEFNNILKQGIWKPLRVVTTRNIPISLIPPDVLKAAFPPSITSNEEKKEADESELDEKTIYLNQLLKNLQKEPNLKERGATASIDEYNSKIDALVTEKINQLWNIIDTMGIKVSSPRINSSRNSSRGKSSTLADSNASLTLESSTTPSLASNSLVSSHPVNKIFSNNFEKQDQSSKDILKIDQNMYIPNRIKDIKRLLMIKLPRLGESRGTPRGRPLSPRSVISSGRSYGSTRSDGAVELKFQQHLRIQFLLDLIDSSMFGMSTPESFWNAKCFLFPAPEVLEYTPPNRAKLILESHNDAESEREGVEAEEMKTNQPVKLYENVPWRVDESKLSKQELKRRRRRQKREREKKENKKTSYEVSFKEYDARDDEVIEQEKIWQKERLPLEDQKSLDEAGDGSREGKSEMYDVDGFLRIENIAYTPAARELRRKRNLKALLSHKDADGYWFGLDEQEGKELLANLRPRKRRRLSENAEENSTKEEQDDGYRNDSDEESEEEEKIYVTEGPDESWRIHIMEYLPLEMNESVRKAELGKEESLDEDADLSAEDESSNVDSQMTDGSNSRTTTANAEDNLMTSRPPISARSNKSGQSTILSPRQGKNRTEDIYDVTEPIPSNSTQLFFLTFVNPFGLAWDCSREEFVVWRYAKTRQWPPPFPYSSIKIRKLLELEAELERRAEEEAKRKKIRRQKKDPFQWEVELLHYNTILSRVPVILSEEFDEDKDNNNVSLMSQDARDIYDAVLIRSLQAREEKERLKQMEIDGFSASEANEDNHQLDIAGSVRGTASRSGTRSTGLDTANSSQR